jgi:hypothetical protein
MSPAQHLFVLFNVKMEGCVFWIVGTSFKHFKKPLHDKYPICKN